MAASRRWTSRTGTTRSSAGTSRSWTMNTERLRELRDLIREGEAIRVGDTVDLLALIDSALNPPGEIGGIVEGLRASLQVSRPNGRGDEVKCYEGGIAHLLAPSQPGEQ